MMIGILADDLTGAADSVAPFAMLGLDADVQPVHTGKLPSDLATSDARAWTTGTRDMAAARHATIRRIVRAATRRLQRFSPLVNFKKIDSTLRGHLRIELDAMRTELSARIAIVCPAFPANGRLVRGGVLHIGGEAAQKVRGAFEMDGDPLARELDLQTLRVRSLVELARLFEQWHAQSVHTLFCDAESDADLEILATVVLMCAEMCLPVGSAGLSSAIAAQVQQVSSPSERIDGVCRELGSRPCPGSHRQLASYNETPGGGDN